MFCSNCGAPLVPGAAFCQECGTAVPQRTQAAAPVEPAPRQPVGATPVQRAPKRSRRKTCLMIAGALFGLLVICSIIGSLTYSEPEEQAAATTAALSTAVAVAAELTTAPTGVPEPTAPTATPAPTETPSPTNTPEPTATPAPPTPTLIPPPPTMPPAPVVLEGRGQTVTDPFVPPATINRATFQHTGESNFAVHTFAPNGDEDLLINTIGNYAGTRPIIGERDEWRFEIEADGPWKVTIEAVPEDLTAAEGMEGRGDAMSGLFMPTATGATPFEFSHQGESNFAVYVHCAGGSDLVQNEIGNVSGSSMVRFEGSPCVWEVQADGQWSIRPR